MSDKGDVILRDESVDLVGDLNVRDEVDGQNTLSVEADSGTLWTQTLTVGGDPNSKKSRVTIRALVDDHPDDTEISPFIDLIIGDVVRIPEDSRVTIDGERGEIALGGNGQAGRLILLNADGTEGVEITATGEIGHFDNTGTHLSDLMTPEEKFRQEIQKMVLENQKLKQKVERLEEGVDSKLDKELQKLRQETITKLDQRVKKLENRVPPGR